MKRFFAQKSSAELFASLEKAFFDHDLGQ